MINTLFIFSGLLLDSFVVMMEKGATLRRQPVKNLLLRALLVYIPTMALVFGFVWLNQFIEPLAASAYRDIFINYTGLFAMVSAIAVFRQKRKAAHSPD